MTGLTHLFVEILIVVRDYGFVDHHDDVETIPLIELLRVRTVPPIR